MYYIYMYYIYIYVYIYMYIYIRPVDEDFYVEKNGTKIHLIPLDAEFSAE